MDINRRLLNGYVKEGAYIENCSEQAAALSRCVALIGQVQRRAILEAKQQNFCFEKLVLEVFETLPEVYEMMQEEKDVKQYFFNLVDTVFSRVGKVNEQLYRCRCVAKARRNLLKILGKKEFSKVLVSFDEEGNVKRIVSK